MLDSDEPRDAARAVLQRLAAGGAPVPEGVPPALAGASGGSATTATGVVGAGDDGEESDECL
jgi:hypothetical protein